MDWFLRIVIAFAVVTLIWAAWEYAGVCGRVGQGCANAQRARR
jgi:hypothetical protein